MIKPFLLSAAMLGSTGPLAQIFPLHNPSPASSPRVTTPTVSASKVSQLFVFGDSLSDNGNVFRATNGTYPPPSSYFQGRYSNGPVWVEDLANRLGVSRDRTKNFAYGGALTSNAVNDFGIPGVLRQVQLFANATPKADPNALYVIWGGANDYLNSASTPTNTIANLSQSIEVLSKAGAKQFLVANLPDLGRLPSTRNTAAATALSNVTKAHNAALAQTVSGLERKLGNGTKVYLLNADRAYQDAIAAPKQFGYTNVSSACLNNAACTQPNHFLFWDGIHPTARTHQILANAAYSVLQSPVSVSANP